MCRPKTVLFVILAATVIGVGAAVAGIAYFGSLPGVMGFLLGESLVLDKSIYDLGVVPGGERYPIEIKVTNITGHPVQLTGARVSCKCVVVSGLPMTVDGGATVSLQVQLGVNAVAGVTSQVLILYTDADGQSEIETRVRATVQPLETANRGKVE